MLSFLNARDFGVGVQVGLMVDSLFPGGRLRREFRIEVEVEGIVFYAHANPRAISSFSVFSPP